MTTQQEKSYEWVVNAINSSTNPFHIECCKKLIELYINKFNAQSQEGELMLMLSNKENNINFI